MILERLQRFGNLKRISNRFLSNTTKESQPAPKFSVLNFFSIEALKFFSIQFGSQLECYLLRAEVFGCITEMKRKRFLPRV